MIIFRYLSRDVIAHMLAIVLMLLLIFMINLFANYMDSLSDGKLTLLALLQIISMQVPLLLSYLLPLALFLSILIVYSKLCLQNEMVVLQAASFSRARLYIYTLVYSLVVLAIVTALMLYVEPLVQKSRLQLKADAYAQATLSKITPKRFIGLGKLNGYFYAESEENFHARLNKVLWVHKLQTSADDAKNSKATARPTWDVVKAKWANDQVLPGVLAHYLVFHDGVEYVGVPGRSDFKVTHFASYGVRLQPKASVIGHVIKFAPTAQLFAIQAHNRYARAELEWRLAIPISGLLLVFIAVYFSQLNPRRAGNFMKMFPAVLLYIIYADLMFVARGKIEAGTKLGNNYGMWWVHALFLALVLMLLALDFKLPSRTFYGIKKLLNIGQAGDNK